MGVGESAGVAAAAAAEYSGAQTEADQEGADHREAMVGAGAQSAGYLTQMDPINLRWKFRCRGEMAGQRCGGPHDTRRLACCNKIVSWPA
jgi:hypothetical protein